MSSNDAARGVGDGALSGGVLIHEWISEAGGSEKVFAAMAEAFPDADLRVLWSDVERPFGSRTVRESWLASTPLRRSKALSLPLMPATWRTVKGGPYEWMLVSSHLFAHHARVARQPASSLPKLVYAHTPARYIWNPELDARGDGLLARIASSALKPLDRRRAQEAEAVAANSRYVGRRVAEAWQRESTVIYPPVDVTRIKAGAPWSDTLDGPDESVLLQMPAGYVLGASRFIPYKRLDLVIEAGEAMGRPVVIAGAGPEEQLLRARAGRATVPVHFVIQPSDRLLYALFERASAYIFPSIEDFGIMPVEAMALGTPVIANVEGGAGESVDGGGGVLLADFVPSAWKEALERVERLKPSEVADHVDRFSAERFITEIRAWVAKATR